jgi:hypothetical protein
MDLHYATAFPQNNECKSVDQIWYLTQNANRRAPAKPAGSHALRPYAYSGHDCTWLL